MTHATVPFCLVPLGDANGHSRLEVANVWRTLTGLYNLTLEVKVIIATDYLLLFGQGGDEVVATNGFGGHVLA